MQTEAKSFLGDLHTVVDVAMGVRFISEPLASFDEDRDALEVREFMEIRDYDVVGIRRDGRVVAFAKCVSLGSGVLSQYSEDFDDRNVLVESSSN